MFSLFAILSLIRIYTVCHSQQSGQGLHYLPFSAVWSRSRFTLSFSGTVRSGSILYALLCSLVRVCTICHSQHYSRSLHYLRFSAFWSGSTLFAIISSLINVCSVILSRLIRVYTICHSQQPDQVQAQLSFSGMVWTGSTLFAILSNLLRVYTVWHSQQPYQSLHYLPFSVWSESTLFAIHSSLIIFS